MTTVDAARREWAEGHRRFVQETASDPVRADVLHRQLDVVSDELRRRVGGTFTLAELAAAYGDADGWILTVLGEQAPSRGWAGTASLAGDAAFHAYSRAAQDYAP
ncbi:MAG TPA: hypothetical protein VH305_01285 [Gaiella sp.]|jgi:hypothetical protein